METELYFSVKMPPLTLEQVQEGPPYFNDVQLEVLDYFHKIFGGKEIYSKINLSGLIEFKAIIDANSTDEKIEKFKTSYAGKGELSSFSCR